MAHVQDGKTLWTFNTSTGSGIAYEAVNKNDPTKIETGDAVTPEGLFHTTRERSEGWWEGDLGKIYKPKYFRGGVAVHGMTSVPNHPVSQDAPLSVRRWTSRIRPQPLRITVWCKAAPAANDRSRRDTRGRSRSIVDAAVVVPHGKIRGAGDRGIARWISTPVMTGGFASGSTMSETCAGKPSRCRRCRDEAGGGDHPDRARRAPGRRFAAITTKQ